MSVCLCTTFLYLIIKNVIKLLENNFIFCRYIVATQDKSLQNTLYHVPAVPVMHFNGLSVILKSPSPTSIQSANLRKQSRYG